MGREYLMMALATASTYLWKGKGMVGEGTEAGIGREKGVLEATEIETGYVSEDIMGIFLRGQLRFL